MKNTTIFSLILVLLPLTTGCSFFHDNGAGPPKAKCETTISYTEGNWVLRGLTIPYINVTIGELSRKPETLQTASAMSQIFDLYQFRQCELINTYTKGSPEYIKAVNDALDATFRLATLGTLASAYNAKPNETLPQIAEWVTSSTQAAKAIKSTSSNDKDIAKIQLEDRLKAAAPEIQDLVRKHAPSAPRIAIWDLIPEVNKQAMVKKLIDFVQLLANALNLDKDEIRANIMMPGGDGYLYIPQGLAVKGNLVDNTPFKIRIPLDYGAAGVAYESRERQFLVYDRETVEFRLGKTEDAVRTQRYARKYLLPGEEALIPTAKWIISIPVKNVKGEVMAVISLSSKNEKREPELIASWEKLGSEPISLLDSIAKSLTLK